MSKCWYCNKEIKSGDKVEIMHKDCFNKIADLEAKLAEKEFEHSRDLDRLNEELKSCKYAVGQMWELLNDKDKEIEDIKDHQKDLCLRCGGLTHIEYEQDKIEFAVNELEKLSNTIYTDMGRDVYDIIVCQINELKEMK